jgi:DNA-binding FrmR family transcriptional regulator
MPIMPDTTTNRNQRIAASIRRIQGQLAAIERSLAEVPNGSMLLQRVAAARRAISGLMTYLMEERLRTLQLDYDVSDAIEEMIEIVRDYLA